MAPRPTLLAAFAALAAAAAPAAAEERAAPLCSLLDARAGVEATAARGPVPTNAVFLGDSGAVTSLVLQDDAGALRTLTASALGPLSRFAVADDPLPPDTTFAVFCLPGRGGTTTLDTQTHCAGITTAAGDDHDPPAPPTVEPFAPAGAWVPEPECGAPVNATRVGFNLTGLDDDVSAAILRRTLGGEESATIVDARIVPSDARDLFIADIADDGGDATYTVTVVDAAGNESEAQTFDASLGCPGSCAQTDGALFSATAGALALLTTRRRRRRSRNDACPPP